VILPDLNLVVYAHNRDAPGHEVARAWWEGLAAGTASNSWRMPPCGACDRAPVRVALQRQRLRSIPPPALAQPAAAHSGMEQGTRLAANLVRRPTDPGKRFSVATSPFGPGTAVGTTC